MQLVQVLVKTIQKKLAAVFALKPELKFICIDVANGYSEYFADFVKSTRKQYPDKVIIAGNVVTGEMVEELILSGADIVKVGIGPGSVCTTRVKTGVGYPQLSAIIECADAAHGLGGHIISDGGCTTPGDIAKLLAQEPILLCSVVCLQDTTKVAVILLKKTANSSENFTE